MEYVSKGNLEEEDDLSNDRNGEMYLMESNDENSSKEINGNHQDDESWFEVKRNGFNKNSEFNTDKEFNFEEVASELEKLKSAGKIADNFNNEIQNGNEKEKYSDLFYWNSSSIVTPSDLEFLSDL